MIILEILKRGKLFIDEFKEIDDKDKDKLIEGVDRTPSQMIAYQLGWMNLILKWEDLEKKGITVITPSPDYKWNNLGGLYDEFYKTYEKYNLEELITMFQDSVERVIKLINIYTEEELFKQGSRQWAGTTPSNWSIWKWIHINTVAPFKSFRTKIRKWKKLNMK